MEQANVQTLIDAIEHADCITPHIPGRCEYSKVAGVLTCLTPTDDPMSNKAFLAQLEVDSVEATVDEVMSYFAEKRKPFSWIVGPSTTPADLGARLEAHHGFERSFLLDGMYLEPSKADIDVSPSVRVCELPVDEPGPAVEIMARGFNMPVEVSRQLHETFALSARTQRSRIYTAYLDGVDVPVACGYVSYYPDQPMALLCGGATLDEYRGRGLYKALLARRLEDIANDGIKEVIVLADQRTSAPICAKVGFIKVCELQMYIWRPDDRATTA